MVEQTISEIEQKLKEKDIKPKWETLQMVRSKLLEFVFRQEPNLFCDARP